MVPVVEAQVRVSLPGGATEPPKEFTPPEVEEQLGCMLMATEPTASPMMLSVVVPVHVAVYLRAIEPIREVIRGNGRPYANHWSRQGL